ncbi:hypothetical protein JW964_21685 [candidate division KSB1 bacterium]|nr:hypothetical protein [candidate division KSB1 bacterium]
MKLKEIIQDSINNLNIDELVLLYEQIKLLENMRSLSIKRTEAISIEKVHALTCSSGSSWAEAVIGERADRI